VTLAPDDDELELLDDDELELLEDDELELLDDDELELFDDEELDDELELLDDEFELLVDEFELEELFDEELLLDEDEELLEAPGCGPGIAVPEELEDELEELELDELELLEVEAPEAYESPLSASVSPAVPPQPVRSISKLKPTINPPLRVRKRPIRLIPIVVQSGGAVFPPNHSRIPVELEAQALVGREFKNTDGLTMRGGSKFL